MRARTARIVLHHTGGGARENPDAAAVHAAHRRLGWAGIGYHYLVRRDGTIERGRPAPAAGAHAEGWNGVSLGVALCGNFCLADPSDAQLEACAMLLAVLAASSGVPLDAAHVVGHRALAATACPGDALMARLPLLLGKAAWYAAR